MSKLEQEIQRRTLSFATELATLIKQAALESVSQALSGEVTPAGGRGAVRRGRLPRAASAKPAKGGRRSPEQLAELENALLADVTKQPGRGIEAIAASIGVSTKELTRPAQKLIKAKQLKTRGQKRATKYYPK